MRGVLPSNGLSQSSTPVPGHAFIIILPGVEGIFEVALYTAFPSTYHVIESDCQSNPYVWKPSDASKPRSYIYSWFPTPFV